MENINTLSIKSLSSDEINKIEEFRKAKQTAILTILFSDIVNSSLATEKLGENTFARLRHIHDELFRQIMTRDNAGLIIKEIGDSFLCVFAEPAMAVKRSVEFQKAIYANRDNLSSNGYCLTVRIGIHLGQVAIENNLSADIFGRHVNRAARIQNIANGGQILCSYTVWENANELLNNNSDEKISGVSYGKVKLKGIPEKINIYGFYSRELPIPNTPTIVTWRKRKNILLIGILAVLILSGIIFFIDWKNNFSSTNSANSKLRKRNKYYLQFDFSEMKNVSDKNERQDTVMLKDKLTAQTITSFLPDSIVPEVNIIESYAKTGGFFKRHKEWESKFFKDTLNFKGTVFIKLINKPHPKDDSVTLEIKITTYGKDSSFSSDFNTVSFGIKNLETDFRNYILNERISENTYHVQGTVINANDSIVLFKLEPNSILSKGTDIRFNRKFLIKTDYQKWIDFNQLKINYYKNIRPDTSKYNKAIKTIERQMKHMDKTISVGEPIFINGRVIEIYDSTGQISWRRLELNPPIYFPSKGDEIYFK